MSTKNRTLLTLGIIFLASGIVTTFAVSFLYAITPYAIFLQPLGLLTPAGVVLLIISLIRNSNDKKRRGSAGNDAGIPISANEQASSQAQFGFNKKLEAFTRNDTRVVDETVEAKLFAQAVEEQNLKAPATAVFADIDEMTATQSGNGVYVVSGWVDSQNSYGAMLRTKFSIRVFRGAGTWKTVDRFIPANVAIRRRASANFLGYLVLGAIITAALFFFFRYVVIR